MLRQAAVLLATFWIGTLIGVSFIATPVKFKVPSLARPAALEVGRLTFRLFSRVERGLAILLVAALIAAGGPAWPLALAGLAAALVAIQSAWLLPALNRRVDAVVRNATTAPSRSHFGYSAAEVLKLLALLALVGTGIGPAP